MTTVHASGFLTTAVERQRRRDGLDCVIGTMAAEGESISPDALAIMEQYVNGEITAEERRAKVLALIDSRQ